MMKISRVLNRRYSAILYPMRPRLRRTSTLVLAGLTWLCSAVVSAPEALCATIREDEGRLVCTVDWPQLRWFPNTPKVLLATAVGETTATVAPSTHPTTVSAAETQVEAHATSHSAAPHSRSSGAFLALSDETITSFREQSVNPLAGPNAAAFGPTKAPASPASTTSASSLAAELSSPESTQSFWLHLDENEVNTYYMTFLMVVNYVVPLLVLWFAYSRVAYVLWFGGIVGEAAGHGDEGSRTKKKVRALLQRPNRCPHWTAGFDRAHLYSIARRTIATLRMMLLC